ncbi:hypothetical protein FN846DRAFT_912978 [Sphaerosporella brunnea]|uniref:Uncharacterized protein n=1 Tax=Sphaerosporella brunnea TaxID=1250544 RepID=A0A5J5EGJ2_9PEZI|nr:hypothetical protein FN846DRAFT_912978 [Sphaerosporella brunnea]
MADIPETAIARGARRFREQLNHPPIIAYLLRMAQRREREGEVPWRGRATLHRLQAEGRERTGQQDGPLTVGVVSTIDALVSREEEGDFGVAQQMPDSQLADESHREVIPGTEADNHRQLQSEIAPDGRAERPRMDTEVWPAEGAETAIKVVADHDNMEARIPREQEEVQQMPDAQPAHQLADESDVLNPTSQDTPLIGGDNHQQLQSVVILNCREKELKIDTEERLTESAGPQAGKATADADCDMETQAIAPMVETSQLETTTLPDCLEEAADEEHTVDDDVGDAEAMEIIDLEELFRALRIRTPAHSTLNTISTSDDVAAALDDGPDNLASDDGEAKSSAQQSDEDEVDTVVQCVDEPPEDSKDVDDSKADSDWESVCSEGPRTPTRRSKPRRPPATPIKQRGIPPPATPSTPLPIMRPIRETPLRIYGLAPQHARAIVKLLCLGKVTGLPPPPSRIPVPASPNSRVKIDEHRARVEISTPLDSELPFGGWVNAAGGVEEVVPTVPGDAGDDAGDETPTPGRMHVGELRVLHATVDIPILEIPVKRFTLSIPRPMFATASTSQKVSPKATSLTTPPSAPAENGSHQPRSNRVRGPKDWLKLTPTSGISLFQPTASAAAEKVSTQADPEPSCSNTDATHGGETMPKLVISKMRGHVRNASEISVYFDAQEEPANDKPPSAVIPFFSAPRGHTRNISELSIYYDAAEDQKDVKDLKPPSPPRIKYPDPARPRSPEPPWRLRFDLYEPGPFARGVERFHARLFARERFEEEEAKKGSEMRVTSPVAIDWKDGDSQSCHTTAADEPFILKDNDTAGSTDRDTLSTTQTPSQRLIDDNASFPPFTQPAVDSEVTHHRNAAISSDDHWRPGIQQLIRQPSKSCLKVKASSPEPHMISPQQNSKAVRFSQFSTLHEWDKESEISDYGSERCDTASTGSGEYDQAGSDYTASDLDSDCYLEDGDTAGALSFVRRIWSEEHATEECGSSGTTAGGYCSETPYNGSDADSDNYREDYDAEAASILKHHRFEDDCMEGSDQGFAHVAKTKFDGFCDGNYSESGAYVEGNTADAVDKEPTAYDVTPTTYRYGNTPSPQSAFHAVEESHTTPWSKGTSSVLVAARKGNDKVREGMRQFRFSLQQRRFSREPSQDRPSSALESSKHIGYAAQSLSDRSQPKDLFIPSFFITRPQAAISKGKDNIEHRSGTH